MRQIYCDLFSDSMERRVFDETGRQAEGRNETKHTALTSELNQHMHCKQPISNKVTFLLKSVDTRQLQSVSGEVSPQTKQYSYFHDI